MKRNDLIICLSVSIYCYLFYHQSFGANLAIFSLVLCLLLLLKPVLFRNGKWLLAAVSTIFTAFSVSMYGHTISVIANVISLVLLAGFSVRPSGSVISGLLHSFYSLCSAPVFLLIEVMARKKNFNEEGGVTRKIWLIVVPLLITLLFFLMYKETSPLFRNFAERIHFNLVSFDWLAFLMSGFILMYGYLNARPVVLLNVMEERSVIDLRPASGQGRGIFGIILGANDEYLSAIILFSLLNGLILIVNALDIDFLYMGGTLPAGVSYSQYLHQGVGMLIFSVLISVVVILFYFRGNLNFHEKSRLVKVLAVAWIIQNLVLLLSTCYRNDLYIMGYGLTYKRIGVYVYLFIAAVFLITTLIKLIYRKSNYFLVISNGWVMYFSLVLVCCVNWPLFVARYNLGQNGKVDRTYLAGLGPASLPVLFIFDHEMKSVSHNKEDAKPDSGMAEEANYEKIIGMAVFRFMELWQSTDWRSWNYSDSRAYKELLELNNGNVIRSLTLSDTSIRTLWPIRNMVNLHTLSLRSCRLSGLYSLAHFKKLETLDLHDNGLTRLKGISLMSNLRYLDISANQVTDFSPLYQLKQLREVHVDRKITPAQYLSLKKHLVKTKITIH